MGSYVCVAFMALFSRWSATDCRNKAQGHAVAVASRCGLGGVMYGRAPGEAIRASGLQFCRALMPLIRSSAAASLSAPWLGHLGTYTLAKWRVTLTPP